jgi:hypothetical protein
LKQRKFLSRSVFLGNADAVFVPLFLLYKRQKLPAFVAARRFAEKFLRSRKAKAALFPLLRFKTYTQRIFS